MTLARINREYIVRENGKATVFTTLRDALEHISEVRRHEPR